MHCFSVIYENITTTDVDTQQIWIPGPKLHFPESVPVLTPSC